MPRQDFFRTVTGKVMPIKNEYKIHHYLSIPEYNNIIVSSFIRMEAYKRNYYAGEKIRYWFIYREVQIVRHCKIMISYVQSQLN